MPSNLVTYDAICKATAGDAMAWVFRDVLGTCVNFYDANQNQISGTLLLLPVSDPLRLREIADQAKIYLVRWSDDQFTLERIF